MLLFLNNRLVDRYVKRVTDNQCCRKTVRRDNAGGVESYPYILKLRDHTLPLPSHQIHNIYAGTALVSWIVFIIS